MKNVLFDKVVITNFLSVGETPIVVDFKKGLHAITGVNLDKPDRQNGVGKSTIADAVYFAVFGDTMRDIKKEFISNNETGGKTQVELYFRVQSPMETNSYHVVRTLSPTKVSLYKDGEDITRDSISNTTSYLCEIISASPAVFQNCVIMTLNNATPFMAKGKVEKRKFIEDVFGLEVFSKMASTLQQAIADNKKEGDLTIARIDEIKNSIKSYQTQKEIIDKKRQDSLNLYTERYNNNKRELEELKSALESKVDVPDIDETKIIIQKLEDKLVEVDAAIQTLVENITQLRSDVMYKKDRYSKIGTTDSKCPVCLRSIDEHDADLIKSEKEEILADISSIKEKIEIKKTELDNLKANKEKIKKAITIKNNIVNKINLHKQNINNINDRIKQLQDWQRICLDNIKAAENNTNEFDAFVDDSNVRLDDAISRQNEINATSSKLDVVKFVISEEGVKSYIVNKLLDLLNGRLFYYLKKLDSNSICRFNEYFEEEIVNEKGKVCSYFNFSGAERKAMDLACLFAFSDIRRTQGGVSYNIAIYDELFDSSFDSKGIDLVVDILSERIDNYNECAFIISHRKESLKAITGDTIYLEKKDGITTRVDICDM
jgi:DNA repair exonuclease SbcCD ATPase subunit